MRFALLFPGMRLPSRSGRWIVPTLLAAIVWGAWPYLTTAAFLYDIAVDRPSPLFHRGGPPVATDVLVPTRDGDVTARLYVPPSPARHPVIVFPGIHTGGVDEPRLATFSRRLAATGVTVMTVPLPELRVFRVTGKSTDVIEDTTRWLAAQPRYAPDGRVSMVGISFAGGLALVAAGRTSLAGHVELVLSLGGHGDLPRALHYLCTGRLPDGTLRPPHEYGLAIIALGAAPQIVPTAEVPGLEDTIRLYLDGAIEEDGADADTERVWQAQQQANALPEPARAIARALTGHDVAALGQLLDPFVDGLAADPALSPERSPATHAPVFLLHGDQDNVIPSTETPMTAAYLRAHGNTNVHALLTPALTHAGLQAVGPADALTLVRFWAQLRDEVQR